MSIPGSASLLSRLNIESSEQERPLVVTSNKKGVVVTLLKELDKQVLAAHKFSILSKKQSSAWIAHKPFAWIAHELTPGTLGLIKHGDRPKLLIEPGDYPPFPFRNWWARSYCGSRPLSELVIQFQGLTIVQLLPNQAAVISDPLNEISVITDRSYVALALTGKYDVLSIIDQTRLDTPFKDNVTKAILGWTQEVKMRRNTGRSGEREFVVALFLNIHANNCAILQKGEERELLSAGQHYRDDPDTVLRAMFTCGENQFEMTTKDIYTLDQVPVAFTIYLKWQLVDPLKLTTYSYNTPYEVLQDNAQLVLIQIVSDLNYSSIVRQRSLVPGDLDGREASPAFLDVLRRRAKDNLCEAVKDYGIRLMDLVVIDHRSKGETARTMDAFAARALQAQVEAANLERENSNKVKFQQGLLDVSRVQADSVVAKAKGDAAALQIAAEAQAAAAKLAAQAEAEAIRSRALVDQGVENTFAREMSRRRVEVSKVQAFGSRTVFVPMDTGSGSGNIGNALGMGMGMIEGMSHGQQ